MNLYQEALNFSITQQPDVKIEYVGDPIYVPPSANPNYTPAVDIKDEVNYDKKNVVQNTSATILMMKKVLYYLKVVFWL